jgi:TrmH family RNA methyltransferase
MVISSPQNGRIKQLVKLNNRRQRDAARLTLVEGEREVRRALAAGVVPQTAFVCPELLTDKMAAAQLQQLVGRGMEWVTVTTAVFQKIAYRGESGGVVLLVPYWPTQLADLPPAATPFFVVVDNVEKPGNLGAILRTADAAGVDGVIVTGDGSTDIFNPNVVRASLGTLFHVPVAVSTVAETAVWLRQRGVQMVAATPVGRVSYTAVKMNAAVAIVMGSEAHGLGKDWLSQTDTHVVIPMHGIADSLNLATATALLLYEVVRQRQAH